MKTNKMVITPLILSPRRACKSPNFRNVSTPKIERKAPMIIPRVKPALFLFNIQIIRNTISRISSNKYIPRATHRISISGINVTPKSASKVAVKLVNKATPIPNSTAA